MSQSPSLMGGTYHVRLCSGWDLHCCTSYDRTEICPNAATGGPIWGQRMACFFFLFFFLSRFLFDGVCYNGTRISGQDSKVCHRHWKEMIKHAVSVEVILNSWLLWAVKLWVVFTIFYFNPAHLCCTPAPVAFSPPFALGFTVLLCSSCWCDWINFVIAFHVLVLAQCNLDCCQIWSTKCQIRTGCSRFLCCLKICVTKATTQSIQVGHDLLSLIFDWGQFCTGNS